MEGYMPVTVSDAAYDELMATIEEAKTQSIARQKGQQQPGGCTLVVIVRLPGPTIDQSCGGSCGFIDRLLGRSCQMVGSTTPGGLETTCMCSGGWFDRIFR